MILPIYVYGSDVLRANAREIDFATYEGLQKLIANMQETMERADGVGIAAPQVGLAIRLLIVDGKPIGEDDPELAAFRRVMINPALLEASEETAEYSEGCLSVPDIHADITRPARIKVKYLNEKGEEAMVAINMAGSRYLKNISAETDFYLFIPYNIPNEENLISFLRYCFL